MKISFMCCCSADVQNSKPTQFLGYRICAFANTTVNHENPSFTLEIHVRWNNPSRSLDEAQDAFEKWTIDSNLKHQSGASNLKIKSLLHA
mmetsp:Transcript_17588/g.24431  ORF Transcript_17588/g.24431 Transcript_17588/m.24431 type:complete len:90 (+) Transcript_17588:98-367(+)